MGQRLSRLVLPLAVATVLAWGATSIRGEVLPKQRLLDQQSFWDNRDWDWYRQQIPFFECPDAQITTTYYYRWELLTKHLTYGSPDTGYTFTEFIDRPFWSGAYGAISCPAGHQLYEARWLNSPRIANDYTRYWFRTPGAQPRNYSTWLADAAWSVHQVHPNSEFLRDLLPDLIKNYQGWEQRHFVPEVGLFWQTGHDDGMEFNINSRQTKDLVRGAEGYRPSFNAYMWADAMAISRMARLAGEMETAQAYQAKAEALKQKLQSLLWDPRRGFFLQMYRHDEERDGHKIKGLTRTYDSGQFAGSPHGRELIGYVPWQFGLPDRDRGFETAWRFLMDGEYFFADFGPTTVERHDPLFVLQKTCCWWSGQSWPYATTQTLKAMANLLQSYDASNVVTAKDYAQLLSIYARSHRKMGQPYLAEALHPDTGSFEGHDSYNHSEHYFHSGFCDLVITGLVGLRPRDDAMLEIHPLAPAEWDYLAVDDVPYRGYRLAIVWDRHGDRYGMGPGLHVLADGKRLASTPGLTRLTVPLPERESIPPASSIRFNYAVNNQGDAFPRITASFTSPRTSVSKLQDGNYWYHRDPPNRWTCEGSPNDVDSLIVDLGMERPIDTVKLYLLDDETAVVPPSKIEIETWQDERWQPIAELRKALQDPLGHRPNMFSFAPLRTARIRVLMTHRSDGKSGLTELEIWGDGSLPYESPRPPAGNFAYNPRPNGFPQASASHSDRFGGTPERAIDGKIVYDPTPFNRWTSYESPNAVDWFQLDFGQPRDLGRLELHLYDDRGGVQAPEKYVVQHWLDEQWRDVEQVRMEPEAPAGGRMNTVRFTPVNTTKIRILFTNKGKARSGLTEIEAWKE